MPKNIGNIVKEFEDYIFENGLDFIYVSKKTGIEHKRLMQILRHETIPLAIEFLLLCRLCEANPASFMEISHDIV